MMLTIRYCSYSRQTSLSNLSAYLLSQHSHPQITSHVAKHIKIYEEITSSQVSSVLHQTRHKFQRSLSSRLTALVQTRAGSISPLLISIMTDISDSVKYWRYWYCLLQSSLAYSYFEKLKCLLFFACDFGHPTWYCCVSVSVMGNSVIFTSSTT